MLAIFLHPVVAYGNCPADLNPINKGDSAPCTGVLFTQAAAAKIIADLEFSKSKCDVRVMKTQRELTAVCDSRLEKEKINFKNVYRVSVLLLSSGVDVLLCQNEQKNQSNT